MIGIDDWLELTGMIGIDDWLEVRGPLDVTIEEDQTREPPEEMAEELTTGLHSPYPG